MRVSNGEPQLWGSTILPQTSRLNVQHAMRERKKRGREDCKWKSDVLANYEAKKHEHERKMRRTGDIKKTTVVYLNFI